MRSKWDIREILQKNAVTVMFVVLCIIGLICSGQTVSYVMYELFGRLSRNAFIVLALIIPIVAGMGINFAITIGAMAAQIAALWVIEWGISGLTGFLVAMLMTMPIAAFFGYLIGKLMNKMKGQEMIGGLILGYFANGLYLVIAFMMFANVGETFGTFDYFIYYFPLSSMFIVPVYLRQPDPVKGSGSGDQGFYRCCKYHRPFYRPWF